MSPEPGRALSAATIGVLLVAAALLLAPSALAAHTYDSQITGFKEPWGLTIDPADNVWISDPGNKGLITEYGPYPSQTVLGTQNGSGHFSCGGEYIYSLAVSDRNEELYVADSCVEDVDPFKLSGALVPPPWTELGFNNSFVGTDNSSENTAGRIYIANPYGREPYGSGYVQAFDRNHKAIPFEASEPYISGSKITGTPSGPFGEGFEHGAGVSGLTVDDNGNIYVVDASEKQVDQYEASGTFVRSFTGATVPGGFGKLSGVAVDPTTEDVLVVDTINNVIDEFSPNGEYLGHISGTSPTSPFGELSGGIAVNSTGMVYVADRVHRVVDIFAPASNLPKLTYNTPSNPTPTSETLKVAVDPHNGGPITSCHFEYGPSRSYSLGNVPCNPAVFSEPTEVTATVAGLTSEDLYHYRIVVSNGNGTTRGQDKTFVSHWVPNLTTEPATNVTDRSASLNGSFIGAGEDTHYYFQYGPTASFGETTGTKDAGSGIGTLKVEPIEITGLQPLGLYHFRIVATSALGTTYGEDQTFTTYSKPSVDSLSSSNLTATTAEVTSKIDPHGGDTHVHFEYGLTSAYGSDTSPEDIGSTTPQSVTALLTNLEAGKTYHFRLVAENPYGTTDSEDQTFGFYPPPCPNTHLRQITDSSNLPDCRAYELVSPASAGGTTLYPEGPNSPEATNPPRLAFGGFIDTVPGAGEPPNTLGDLYVSTRTEAGWVTKYVGVPGDKTFGDNGPPDEPRSTTGFPLIASPGGVRTDQDMNEFLDWNDGVAAGFVGHFLSPPEFTPHVWNAEGDSLGVWPTVPGYKGSPPGYIGSPIFEQSADFSHYVFQTGAPPGLSLIDNDTVTNTATEVSENEAGNPIPIQPGDTEPNEESLRVPAVSKTGSHILIAARSGPSEHRTINHGYQGCGIEIVGEQLEYEPNLLCPLQTSQLYMRINDAITYEIAPGHPVNYVGETPDGSKVYFTTNERLTSEDTDSSIDMYMWSAEKAEHGEQPLTLVSRGLDGTGNGDSCQASWIEKCGVAPFVNSSYSNPGAEGYIGGSGLSDNSIAAANGDVYFFSPEQLAGAKGVPGQENLYDFRHNTVQYVATFAPQPFCKNEERLKFCSVGPVIRMQVTPTDSRMAFVTASPVTSYNNSAHTEMYTYNPESQEVQCVSCLPDGEPPTSDVYASSDGLFMTNDGRTFFSTSDALVPQDTDGLRDVYEYVEGHAQLISSGTSSKDHTHGIALDENAELFTAGLVGVSAEGTNVYFTTYDSLVGQDHNGTQLKFYDARTDGGFPYNAPAAPCEAADECHGVGSSPEAPFHIGSGAELGSSGNVNRIVRPRAGRKRHHRHHAKQHRKGSVKSKFGKHK